MKDPRTDRSRMPKRHRRRLVAKFLIVAVLTSAIASVVLAGTTDIASGPLGSASTGTVNLSTSAGTTCNVTALTPGDDQSSAGDVPCTLDATYRGTLPAYLSLDVTITSSSPGVDPDHVLPGAPGLYDGTPTGLQLLIRDSSTPPTIYMGDGERPAAPGTVLGGEPTVPGSATARGTHLLVRKAPFTTGQSVTFTVDYLLPASATNAYDGAGSTITLRVLAVQSQSNGSVTGCVAGDECDTTVPGTGPVWS